MRTKATAIQAAPSFAVRGSAIKALSVPSVLPSITGNIAKRSLPRSMEHQNSPRQESSGAPRGVPTSRHRPRRRAAATTFCSNNYLVVHLDLEVLHLDLDEHP